MIHQKITHYELILDFAVTATLIVVNNRYPGASIPTNVIFIESIILYCLLFIAEVNGGARHSQNRVKDLYSEVS